ncbi:uncharacterized protein BDR25DRAFT_354389 [Lindgomyces ingoldianus]|uniref:Uncharacterized protein n=1 Tax=Lindgomyces ingoldianus TaxID=673940 RepID=A0ACB6QYD6_9PLEO|nr:uncharacterized protein BDR25DRAFT_354389 [Lindgomyces ingoldianus]KAF2471896.1 hypothetical protein BDR25DRAFT_354389 [Lindgomyces ingoldianus]
MKALTIFINPSERLQIEYRNRVLDVNPPTVYLYLILPKSAEYFTWVSNSEYIADVKYLTSFWGFVWAVVGTARADPTTGLSTMKASLDLAFVKTTHISSAKSWRSGVGVVIVDFFGRVGQSDRKVSGGQSDEKRDLHGWQSNWTKECKTAVSYARSNFHRDHRISHCRRKHYVTTNTRSLHLKGGPPNRDRRILGVSSSHKTFTIWARANQIGLNITLLCSNSMVVIVVRLILRTLYTEVLKYLLNKGPPLTGFRSKRGRNASVKRELLERLKCLTPSFEHFNSYTEVVPLVLGRGEDFSIPLQACSLHKEPVSLFEHMAGVIIGIYLYPVDAGLNPSNGEVLGVRVREIVSPALE